MKKNKSGMTMISIVLYVTLFFTLSVFVIAMSTNMNTNALSEKGDIIINEDLQKIQYNLVKSCKESDKIDIIENKIVFSNNDEYYFNTEKKILYKNDTVISKNVQEFSIVNLTDLSGISSTQITNIDTKIQNLTVKFDIKKYNKEKSSTIFLSLGAGLYE